MSRRLGLIVGVNHYQDAAFQPLHFAENDARALAQWFVNAKGGKWSPADVQLVQGSHVTRELIESLISQMCMQMAEPGDLLFIYFAGHAFVDEKSGEGYLALSNTRYYEPATGIHLPSLVQQIMGRSRATQVILLLDVFQTGRVWSVRRTSQYDSSPLLGSALVNAFQQQTNRLLLCSCRGNEAVAEMGERGLGFFAHRMIVGLCGPASDSVIGGITLQNLHTYLYHVLGEQQRPQLFGQAQSPFLLVGEMPSTAPGQQTPAHGVTPGVFSPPGAPYSPPQSQPLNNGIQTMGQATSYATATAQPPFQTPGPSTSGMMDIQRQQQIPQILEQARQLLQMQNTLEAFNLVEQVLQIAPQDASALTLKGQILGTMGRLPEALTTVEQLVQVTPNNALAWSMRAVLLSNMGQHQTALAAIERSLELNPADPEAYGIKTTIMANLADTQSKGSSQPQKIGPSVNTRQGGPLSLLIGVGLQVAGFILGLIGMSIPAFVPQVPAAIGFVLASLGMALLCVNAARGAYRHGFGRVLITLFMCLVAAGVLGAAYKLGYTRITNLIKANPLVLVPLLFFGVWLLVAATVPLLLAIGGFIGGLMRKRK